MKYSIFFLIIPALLLAACNPMPEWKSYESKDGWFRAEFPGNPKMEKMPVNTIGRTVTAYMHSVDLRDGALAVCYFDITAEEEKILVFDNLARGSFSNLGTVNYSTRDIMIEGYKGIEAEGKVSKGSVNGIARFRYFLVDGRIFMLQVVGYPAFVKSDNTDKFFKSFKLLEE